MSNDGRRSEPSRQDAAAEEGALQRPQAVDAAAAEAGRLADRVQPGDRLACLPPAMGGTPGGAVLPVPFGVLAQHAAAAMPWAR